MAKILGAVVNGALRRLGLELRRTKPRDPFAVQRELVGGSPCTIFDVGSAVGDVALRYSRLFPGSTIHLFEPFPEFFGRLQEKFGSSPAFKLNHVAISDKQGTTSLSSNCSAFTNSLLSTDPRGATSWGEGVLETKTKLEVPTTTLDLYCQQTGIDRIGILKLDIQGAEFKALQGATSMLKQGKVFLIYLEIIHAPTYIGQRNFEDYLSFCRDLGYLLLDLYNPVRWNHRLLQSDVIFVRDAAV